MMYVASVMFRLAGVVHRYGLVLVSGASGCIESGLSEACMWLDVDEALFDSAGEDL